MMEVKSELIFEISDPNYLLIHVHVVYIVGALLPASEAATASEQPWMSKPSLQVNLLSNQIFKVHLLVKK